MGLASNDRQDKRAARDGHTIPAYIHVIIAAHDAVVLDQVATIVQISYIGIEAHWTRQSDLVAVAWSGVKRSQEEANASLCLHESIAKRIAAPTVASDSSDPTKTEQNQGILHSPPFVR